MDEHTFTIRSAIPADAPALARLRYRFRSELGAAVEPADAFAERATAWLAAHLSTPAWRAWLAVDRADGVVGHCFLQLIAKLPNPVAEAEQIGYVTNLYVVPELRGAGLGGRLLQAALDSCTASEVEALILWPSPESRSLYQRFGFGPPQRLMELPLHPPQPPRS